MKVWHKILVAPVVAIVFLLALGIVSVAMMARQGLAVSQLIKDRGGALELALGAAQDISQAHSGAYRLVMTAGDLGGDKAQAAAKAHLARIDAVVGKVNEFRQRPQLVAQERQQLDAVLPQLAGYRKNVEAAMNAAIAAAGDAKTAMQAADAGFEASTATFNALVDIERKMAAESSAQGVADFKTTVAVFIACVLLAMATALAIALAMGRAIYPVMGMSDRLGRLNETMLPNDIQDLLVRTMSQEGLDNVRADDPTPCAFGGLTGFCFQTSFSDKAGLEMKGKAIAARNGKKLELIEFRAPADFYFDHSAPTVDQLFASISVH